MSRTYSVVLAANSFDVTPDPDELGTHSTGQHARVQINTVTGVFAQKPVTAQEGEWVYPYDTITELQLGFSDGSQLKLELQDCSNQPTWNLGTKVALNAAIAAVQAWL